MPEIPRLVLPQALYGQIRRHGEKTYPHECCGILLGSPSRTGQSLIHKAIPVPNVSPAPASHYRIDPRDLIGVTRQARALGLEIVGFYHSHPNHPAQPSTTDLAEAHWLGCSYLITEIRASENKTCQAGATNSFRLQGICEEDKLFVPEEIVISM